MNDLFRVILPEMILIIAACGLFLLGMSPRAVARRNAPILALVALLGVLGLQLVQTPQDPIADPWNSFRVYQFAHYVKLLAAGIGALLVLLFWPTNREATGNSAMDVGPDTSEFFGLMLLSIAGVFIVAGANDLILLFLGIELASIPTYVMVSMSRPIAPAQEAGVKYFFLGAMSAAVLLFGMSYLYGTTGFTRLDEISLALQQTLGPQGDSVAGQVVAPALTPWQLLAVVMIIAGFAFKIAAVPLHFYAGDVYQGAATPVTAFLSFVPKASGMVALVKLLYVIGGPRWLVPEQIATLLWVLAVLTMTIGNILAVVQIINIKRVLAYSSVAHSGYMLVGLTTLAMADRIGLKDDALRAVLFYLTAYGIMNAAAFGVLMLLPSRNPAPATSAETFEDIAGQGRRHPALGLAMAVACLSLTGIPLTVGFWGKLYLIAPALESGLYWLVILTVINAAISAGYYLRIIAAMFLRPSLEEAGAPEAPRLARPAMALPVVLAVAISAFGALLFGTVLPATELLNNQTQAAIQLERPSGALLPRAAAADPVPLP